MRKGAGYLRVSTGQQVDAYGLPEQRRIVESYCRLHGIEIVEWFIDEGISGVEEYRPKMNALLHTTLDIDCVVVAKSDRVARDIKLYYYYLMLLSKKDIELISATEEVVNDDSGLGDVYKSLMLFVAEQERRNITARTTGGRMQKARSGGYSGGRPPYGYRSIGGKLIINEGEAEIVRIIFRLRDLGEGQGAIARYLNNHGYEPRYGGEFRPDTLRGILKNERLYLGYYKYGKEKEVRGEHEPILGGLT